MTAGDPRDAIAEIASIVGAVSGELLDDALARALDALLRATGAAAAALYAGGPEDPAGMALRAARGVPALVAAFAQAIRAGAAPRAVSALALGEVVGGAGAADALLALGMPGAVVAPGRLEGRTASAVALVPAPGKALGAADVAAARAAAGLLALGLRHALLVRGVADRARELDRQALQLRALNGVTRRLAQTGGEAQARAVIEAEAAALVRAERASLDPAGSPAAAAAAAGDGATARVAIPDPGGRPPRPSVLTVGRAEPPFSDEEIELLEGLAAQAAVALAHARLVEDLRREQAERRDLAAAIVLAQESERRRVAENLHDGPVQGLVAVGLMLDAVVAEDPGVRDDVARAAAAAREAVRGLRRAISDLHPMALDELGFAAATRSVVERLEWKGIEVRVDVAAADDLAPMLRTVAFRILQEAAANILRHADATRVEIASRRQEGEVVIEIADDGRGFDPEDRRPRAAEGHLGLAAIEERAALAGGQLLVTSAAGRGTRLRLTLPADAQPAAPPMRSSASASADSSAKRSSTTT